MKQDIRKRVLQKSYTCSFHGSTPVKTADGYKAIARIQAGDRVLAKDEASGATGYKSVTAQYGNPYQETVYIEVSDGLGKIQTIVSNRIHPFYSDGKWIKAEDLKAGNRLLSESGAEQTVQRVTVKQEPLEAYNLTVADWHTYFVKGDKAETEGVWVHNDCPTKPKPTSHAQQRKEEAKNDSHRSVGDSNRVVREGKQYLDADTGNHVYVKGDKVVILTPDGRQVTQFKNSKANTSKRVKNGKWTPK